MENQFTCRIAGVSISIEPLAEELPNSWVAAFPRCLMVRSGAIDSVPKIQTLVKALQRLHHKTPLRFIESVLCLQKEEWNIISAQDIVLTWLQTFEGFHGQGALLNFAMPHLYFPRDQPPESEFFLKEAAKLSDLLNVGGWEAYCKWVNEDVMAVLESIPLESMDSYTLEAELKNFNHEIGSQLLRNLEREAHQTLLKIGALQQLLEQPSETSDSVMALEKRLLKTRSEIRRLLRFQYETLNQFVQIIPIIEESHPGFIPLKNKAILLSRLIQNHLENPEGKPAYRMHELLWIQLLNEELDVVTVVNCDTGLDRSSLVFAMMLAISLLKQTHPREDIIQFALDWEGIAKGVNQKIAQMGYEAFEHWVLSPSANADESLFKRKAGLVEKFRKIFLEVMEDINIPITQKAGKVQGADWADSQSLSAEFLLFFPIYGEVARPDGHRVKTRIVHLDGEGNVTGLTKAGHFLATQLFI